MNYKTLLEKNNLKVNKYTLKGKVIIIETPLGNFVLKRNYNNNYNYLLSRGFNYLPKIIDSNNEYVLYEYINDIPYNESIKSLDFIKILALIHIKTSHYKEINNIEYKNLYENITNSLNDLNIYYNNLINMIENNIYFSPSTYLIARNISLIFSCLGFLKNELEKWYELVKDKSKVRVSSTYNNVDLNNLLKDENGTYLLGFQNLKETSPIYDLVSFYKKYNLDYDFSYLLTEYEKIFPLTIEEKKLLLILISIPNKMKFTDNELNDVKYVRKEIDEMLNTLKFLNLEEKKQTDNNKNKNNE